MKTTARRIHRPTKEGIKDVYKKWAPIYDRHMKDTGHIAALEQLLNHLPPYLGRGGTLLDIACGTGTAVHYILNRSAWMKENYPKSIAANDFSLDMVRHAKKKFHMGYGVNLLATLNHMLCIARDTEKEDVLKEIERRNRMIQNGLLPRTGFLRQDATTLVLPVPVDAILCTYGFHWFLGKEAVAKNISRLLAPGKFFVSVEEWPIRVTPTEDMTELERTVLNGMTVIPLTELYQIFGNEGLRLVKLFESMIHPGFTSVTELSTGQVEEITFTRPREHSMFGAVFVKE
jgi:SAM-dependent methyltransferase